MSRPLKIILALVSALVVIVAAAMILVVLFVDPNDYKGEISKIVKEKTGRELSFQGDISLSVFPWIGVTTQGVTFSNAPGFGSTPMLRLKSADVSLRLMPLLSGSIALGDIEVSGLEVNLMRNREGVKNWDDLAGSEAADQKAVPETEPKSVKSAGENKINLSISGLKIKNANIVWDDRQADVRQSLENCDITLGAVKAGSPFDFKVQVKLASTSPEIKALTDLTGQATLDLSNQLYILKNVKFSVDASGKDVPGGIAKLVAAADAEVDMKSGTAELKKIDIDAYGAKVLGDVSASGINSRNISFTSNLNMPSFDLAKTLLALGRPVKTADPKALTNVGLSLVASGSPKAVKVESIQINLDYTTAKGSLSFADPDRPDIRCDFKVDKINADRYLPPAGDKKAVEKTSGKTARKNKSGADEKLIPVEMLRKLTLKADFGVDELIIGGAKLEKIVVKAASANGVFQIKPASLNVAGGSFASTATVDARGTDPIISAAAKLSGLDGSKLAMQLNGKKNFAGIMGFNTELSTRGNALKTVFANLNGNFSFKAKDGYVSGLDILFLANDAFSALTGKKDSSEDKAQTAFGEASATAKITKGIARNKDLLVKSPLLRASGNGLMDLNTMTIDYELDAKIVDTLEGQGGKSQKELLGLTVPLDITGPISDPSIMVNLPRFAMALVKGGVNVGADVLKGVGGVVEGLGKTLTGKNSGKNESEKPTRTTIKKKAVEELGNTLNRLFK